MHILSNSFLGTVNRRFRKAPASEESPSREGASPLESTPHEQRTGSATAPIALSTSSRSSKPGSVDPPIVGQDPTTPILQNRKSHDPNSQSEPSDQPEVLALAVQDSEPAGGEPLIPAVDDNDAIEDPIGESPPNSDKGSASLRDLFVRKSNRNPAVRALLKRHQPIDSRALNNELKEFALQIGLPPRNS